MVFDVAVIGGGILGRAIALQLSQSGMTTACIYQRNHFQAQASAAAGGMLGVFSEVSAHDLPERQQLEVAQRQLARDLYDNFVADLSQRSGIAVQLTGGLFVIANSAGEDDALELAAIREAALAFGSRAETVSPRDVPGVAPQTGTVAYEALFLPDEGSVDSRQLLDALERCLELSPQATIVNDRVSTFALADEQFVSVHLASSTQLQCRQVVLAGGAEIPQLLHSSRLLDLGIPPIFAGRGVSLLVQSTLALPHAVRTPNRGFACGLHVVPRAGNLIYLGATNRFSTTPDFERRATLGEINNLLSGAIRELNTSYKDAELTSVSVGYRPVTLDKLPIVGRSTDPRVLVASGTYRNGILLAPLMAQLIAEEILTPGRHADHPFATRRALKPTSQHDLDRWLDQASRKLVTTLCEPSGQLPDGRDKELQRFIYAMLSMTLNPAYDKDGLRRRIERIMARAPIEENMPLLFDMIARYA